jgi:hypothetical protein
MRNRALLVRVQILQRIDSCGTALVCRGGRMAEEPPLLRGFDFPSTGLPSTLLPTSLPQAEPCRAGRAGRSPIVDLTCISHRLSVASPDTTAPATLRSVGLLNVSPRIRLRGPRSQALHPPASPALHDDSR